MPELREWMAAVDARWWWALGLGVGGALLSLVVVAFVLVRLPADFFCRPASERFFRNLQAPWRLIAICAKNVLGLLLVALGIVLSLPGIPGQGLLTVLLGVMLLDIPGRERLERAILQRKPVRRAIDALRSRFHRPPLAIPGTDLPS